MPQTVKNIKEITASQRRYSRTVLILTSALRYIAITNLPPVQICLRRVQTRTKVIHTILSGEPFLAVVLVSNFGTRPTISVWTNRSHHPTQPRPNDQLVLILATPKRTKVKSTLAEYRLRTRRRTKCRSVFCPSHYRFCQLTVILLLIVVCALHH